MGLHQVHGLATQHANTTTTKHNIQENYERRTPPQRKNPKGETKGRIRSDEMTLPPTSPRPKPSQTPTTHKKERGKERRGGPSSSKHRHHLRPMLLWFSFFFLLSIFLFPQHCLSFSSFCSSFSYCCFFSLFFVFLFIMLFSLLFFFLFIIVIIIFFLSLCIFCYFYVYYYLFSSSFVFFSFVSLASSFVLFIMYSSKITPKWNTGAPFVFIPKVDCFFAPLPKTPLDGKTWCLQFNPQHKKY